MGERLPEHLQLFCSAAAASRDVQAGMPDPRKLRAILSAAVEVAGQDTRVFMHCLYCDERECLTDCPHRRLKEALEQ